MPNSNYTPEKSSRVFNLRYQELLKQIEDLPEQETQEELKALAVSVRQSHLVVNDSCKRMYEALADINCNLKYIQFDLEARAREAGAA